jgi:hypothetical protein
VSIIKTLAINIDTPGLICVALVSIIETLALNLETPGFNWQTSQVFKTVDLLVRRVDTRYSRARCLALAGRATERAGVHLLPPKRGAG